MMSHFWGMFKKGPDFSTAAKSGQPQMEGFKPVTPVLLPTAALGAPTADVTATTITGTSALDTQPDARQNPPKQDSTAPAASGPSNSDGQASPSK
jgi:hypothetical protein